MKPLGDLLDTNFCEVYGEFVKARVIHFGFFALGVFFLVSAAGKFLSPADAIEFSGNFVSDAGTAKAVVIAVSVFEAILGLILLTGYFQVQAAVLSAATLLIFLVALAFVAYQDLGVETCGCLGGYVKTSPAVSAGKNLIILSGITALLALKLRQRRLEKNQVV